MLTETNDYTLTPVSRFHPFTGVMELIALNERYSNPLYSFFPNQGMIELFQSSGGRILCDDSFFENIKFTLIMDGEEVAPLKPIYCNNSYPVFVVDNTTIDYDINPDFKNAILFFCEEDHHWYMRFDGATSMPYREEIEDFEGNKYYIGSPYLRMIGSLPERFIGEASEDWVASSGKMWGDYVDVGFGVRINTDNVGYYIKTPKDPINGIYSGRNAYEGKRVRIGWGMWVNGTTEYFELPEKTTRDTIMVSGIAFADSKYVFGQLNSPTGWWECEKIEFEKDFEMEFKKPADSEEPTQPNKTFTWWGFRASFKDASNTERVIQSKKLFVAETPTWR